MPLGLVSGCHLNPAVTVGLAAGGRFPAGQIAPYVIAQVVGECITQLVEREGMSVILVEQHAGFALTLTQDAIILERGAIVRRGTSRQILSDEAALERHVGLRRPAAQGA